MKRRDFLKAAGLFAGACMAPALGFGAEKTVNNKRPNIVLILADDLGLGDVGCYGQSKISTPNIDSLALQGTRYTNFYAGSAVCAPTRCSMMTGLHTGHCTRRDNRTLDRKNPLIPLNASDYTLAQMLQQAGYATGGVGKWGLGNPGTSGTPDQHGFDLFFGYLDQVHAHGHFPEYLYKNTEKVLYPENAEKNQKTYSHDLFEQTALQFIDEHRQEPFFLYCAFTLPHARFEIPDYGQYADQDWPKEEKAYAAMISRLDSSVGKIREKLKELDLEDNTLLIFTSDNGPLQRWVKPFDSSANLRDVKGSLYEGGIHVPMIARWPGVVAEGRTDDTLWWQVDFFATFASLAQAEPPQNLDSKDMLPRLKGKDVTGHDYLYWEIFAPFHQAIRKDNWKAVRHGLKEPLELYDLSTDPFEKENIAAQHPELVKELEQILSSARTESQWWKPVEHRAPSTSKPASTRKSES